MSFEEEKGSIDLEMHSKEHLGGINVSTFLSRIRRFSAHAQGRAQHVVVDDFDDPNLDPSAIDLEDESPYPEVRSAVANTDDPTMPASTFRSWVVGLMWAIIISGVNQFFFFRYPSVTITSVCPSAVVWVHYFVPLAESGPKIVPQLLTYPICKLWARFLPNVTLFGLSLNPGPFTIKEHVIITIMASVGASSAYAVSACHLAYYVIVVLF
jgi:hypothetical protein